VSEPLRVAFVCTGNRFRSPLAAALLEAEDVPVEVASLGTLDLGDEPALPEAVAIAEEHGIDLSAHRARSVSELELGEFDLVLGFERKHVVASVVDAKAQIEHTFTLPELLGLLRASPGAPLPREPAERARTRIRQAHAARPHGFRNNPLPELRDPLGLSPPEQRETAHELADQVTELADRLFA
jgi:protein-tyrosine-phosphatase